MGIGSFVYRRGDTYSFRCRVPAHLRTKTTAIHKNRVVPLQKAQLHQAHMPHRNLLRSRSLCLSEFLQVPRRKGQVFRQRIPALKSM